MTQSVEHYRKIVWGLAISLFDIHIMNINVLPDTVGYILVIVGLRRLSYFNINYSKAKQMALILAVCTTPDFIQFAPNLLTINHVNIWLLIYQSVLTLMKAILIFYLLTAVIQLAKEQDMGDLYQETISRWKLYAVAIGLYLISTPFQLNFFSDWQLAYLALVLIVFIVEITVIVLLNRAGKQLAAADA